MDFFFFLTLVFFLFATFLEFLAQADFERRAAAASYLEEKSVLILVRHLSIILGLLWPLSFNGKFTLRLAVKRERCFFFFYLKPRSHGVTPLISPVRLKPVQVYLHLSCERRRLLE